jgi:hypothetical protein
LESGDLALQLIYPNEDDEGNVESYSVTVKNSAAYDNVTALVAAGLSFRQISKVVDSDRKHLQAAGKIGSIHCGEASHMARIACALGLQSISQIMRNCWAFVIAADESSKAGFDSHLNVRFQFPPIAGVEHSSFHLLPIPMFDRSHTGKDSARMSLNHLSKAFLSKA